jgi:hypothetical protein
MAPEGAGIVPVILSHAEHAVPCRFSMMNTIAQERGQMEGGRGPRLLKPAHNSVHMNAWGFVPHFFFLLVFTRTSCTASSSSSLTYFLMHLMAGRRLSVVTPEFMQERLGTSAGKGTRHNSMVHEWGKGKIRQTYCTIRSPLGAESLFTPVYCLPMARACL